MLPLDAVAEGKFEPGETDEPGSNRDSVASPSVKKEGPSDVPPASASANPRTLGHRDSVIDEGGMDLIDAGESGTDDEMAEGPPGLERSHSMAERGGS